MAADYKVTTTADGDDKACDAHCTLREAVAFSGGPPDRVILPAGNYVLADGELVLNNDTIVGENARTTFIDGGGKWRVLRVIEVQSRVSNVTIRNGNGVGLDPGPGGGIFIHSGSLILQNSTVSGNTATHGGGIAADGAALLVGVTVSGNQASAGRGTVGGGIATSITGGLFLGNSTVSGNTAEDLGSQGGGIHSRGTLSITASTVANNSASVGGGIYVVAPPSGASMSAQNSLFSGSSGGACGGPAVGFDAVNNVVSDDSCQFKDPTNLQSVNPQIGPLGDNGGPSDTHALLPASPAIGRASSCATFDQRGFARVAPCDSGAYEYRPPTLRVVMNVVNDSGGTRAPGDVTVHVRSGLVDVKGSPQPGSDKGTTYVLVAGSSYSASADGVAGYQLSSTGDCAVTLQEGQNATCTITANDIAPKLRVVTSVINDDNGSLELGKVSVHVRLGRNDVPGSPKPGTAAPGAEYELTAGAVHAVAPTPVAGYSASFGGACTEKGTITLALAQTATCTLTMDDGAATLTVDTQAVNDGGGAAIAGDFEVTVSRDGVAIASQPGSGAGTPFSLAADDYVISAAGVPGYTFAVTGDCAADGSITLALQQTRACTITAHDVAPRLTVVTQVVNDQGGTAGPGSFLVHVTRAGADVAGSPQAGSSGTPYTLIAGAHVVSADAVPGYSTAISGACAGDGSITLGVGESRTCTVTANDDPPAVRAQSSAQELPPPERGKTVNALPKSGTVRVKLPGSASYVDLDEAEQLPVGTVVDARKGHVTLVAATDDAGGTATAEFWAGIFRLTQTNGTTVLTLVEKLSCPKAGTASAAAKGKKKRRLWGDGSGKFQTKGKHSAATVVGTKWLVEDKCRSTLTRVVRGRVSVRDFVKEKTVIVRTGKKYVARRR
jgi:CSLREA domain-containing protein